MLTVYLKLEKIQIQESQRPHISQTSLYHWSVHVSHHLPVVYLAVMKLSFSCLNALIRSSEPSLRH